MPAKASPSGLLPGQIQSLPQAKSIPDTVRQAWLEAAGAMDPGQCADLLRAARGFDAHDIEALLAARQGLFHPHGDARSITRAKLLLDLPAEPAPRQQRERAISLLARDHFRRQATARGERVREDLLKKFLAAPAPAPTPWLAPGAFDAVDLVERDGRLLLVDHALVSDGSGATTEPGRFAVRLHHHLLRARAAGLEVGGLCAHAFDPDRWQGREVMVPEDPALAAAIVEAGNHFWTACVQAGEPAPALAVTASTALADLDLRVEDGGIQVPVAAPGARTPQGDPVVVDHYALTPETITRLRDQLAELGAEIFGQAMVKAEAEKMREALTRLIREILPTRALPLDLNRLDMGPVRLKVDWAFQEAPLIEACRGALAMMGQEDAQIQNMLDADNFHHPATWSASELVRLLKEKKGIDAHLDPDLAPAMESGRRWRQDTLVALLKDLERMLPEPVRWHELVDHDASLVGVEVVRAPAAGPGRELRDQTLERVRQATSPIARQVGIEHAQRLQQMPLVPAPRRKKAGP